MPKAIYAVKRGHSTGLFHDYEQVKAAIKGFSGAMHQGFKTREAALAWLHPDGAAEHADVQQQQGQHSMQQMTEQQIAEQRRAAE